MMSAKMANPGFLKIKVFWKKGFDVRVFVHDVTNKILSRDSNYNVNAVMWAKFGNSSTSVREVIIFDQKGWFWFMFNNLGLALGTNLKFYTSVSEGLRVKVRMFWGLIPTFAEVTEKKLVWVLFAPPPLILNTVN